MARPDGGLADRRPGQAGLGLREPERGQASRRRITAASIAIAAALIGLALWLRRETPRTPEAELARLWDALEREELHLEMETTSPATLEGFLEHRGLPEALSVPELPHHRLVGGTVVRRGAEPHGFVLWRGSAGAPLLAALWTVRDPGEDEPPRGRLPQGGRFVFSHHGNLRVGLAAASATGELAALAARLHERRPPAREPDREPPVEHPPDAPDPPPADEPGGDDEPARREPPGTGGAPVREPGPDPAPERAREPSC